MGHVIVHMDVSVLKQGAFENIRTSRVPLVFTSEKSLANILIMNYHYALDDGFVLMSTFHSHKKSCRGFATLTLALYALALIMGALHPILHDHHQGDVAHGLSSSGCEAHLVQSEICSTCATLSNKIADPILAATTFQESQASGEIPDIRQIHEYHDARLPSNRAPPAVA